MKKKIIRLYDDEGSQQGYIKAMKITLDHGCTYPLSGAWLDPLLGLAESRLHIGGFVYGMLGTLTAFLGMTWIFTRDWPQIYGGKPYWPILSFVPITFELTVLFASIGMVVTFYVINGQGPGIKNPIIHPRITDDKFCIAFDTDGHEHGHVDKLRHFFHTSKSGKTKTI